MSTTLDRRKAQKNYAEFDEYISYQLQKTQTGIRSTDIFTALCGAAVFVVSYLLVFVIFDHWVVTGGFGPGMRIILLSGLLIGTLVWLGWKVVWPFFRRVNSLYAARALEQASPDLKSTLINYVDLRSANRDVSPAIIESMERRAAVTLSHAEVDDAIDRSTLLRLSYALLTAVVLFSVYAVASPKKVWPSIVRIFAPGSEVSVSTQTTFLKVDPGDTTILAREFLTITADLSGEVPQEVTLLYTTADGQFVDEPSPMREVEAGLKRYRCILKGNSGEGLLQGLSYRIVAGDASTRTYNVKVSQPPSATVTSLHYSFPDYMELPPEQPIGSGIDTWEGTHIQITATANMPVSSARLQFSDEAEFPARCEEMLMTVADDGVTLTPSKPWQPIIRDDGTYPGFYRIQCRTRDGATDPAPVVHSIRLQADQKPDASTLQPNRDMEVAANAIVPLLIQASDPDFRLSRVILRMKNGSRSLADRPLYKGDDRTKQIQYDLKIADLNVQERDVITWWVEAHDNRLVETPIRTLLDANRSATPQLQFTVRAPIPDEEVNKQLEQDRKRAQEKLDELNQQPGKSDLSPDESEPDAPGQQPEVKSDAPSDSNDPTQEKDDSQPAKSVDNERNSDGDGGGSGNKPESDSEPKSNNQTTKDGEGQTGKSDGDHAETGKKEPGKDDAGTEAKPDSPNTKSGPRKPVSNDGSQDDEILKELLKQNRDSKPNSDQGGNGNDDKANDRQKAGDGGKDQPQHDDRADDDDKSPKKPDNADDSPSQNADQPDPNSTEKNPNAKPDPSSKAETSPKKGADGQTPDEPVNDPSGQPTEDFCF